MKILSQRLDKFHQKSTPAALINFFGQWKTKYQNATIIKIDIIRIKNIMI